MKKSTIIPVLVTIIFCSVIFTICGILLVPAEIKSVPAPAGDTVSGIKYYPDAKNSGVLLLFESGGGAMTYLDFESGRIYIFPYDKNPLQNANLEGYDINYTISLTNEFLCRLCDRLGGVIISEGGSNIRYSSVGLGIKLKESNDKNAKIKIISAFFEKIAKIGLSSDDFMFIIENTDNNLVYPICYHWIEPFKDLAGNCIFG